MWYLQNYPLPLPEQYYKIQRDIFFEEKNCDDQNATQKKFRIEIWTFYLKSAFGINFGLQEVVKLKICQLCQLE